MEEWTTANNDKPIWVRSPKDVEQESYNEFFKSTFKEFLDPLAHSHFAVEGDIEFRSILFIPGMAPFEQQDMMSKSKAIKLFVRRVFISDEFDESWTFGGAVADLRLLYAVGYGLVTSEDWPNWRDGNEFKAARDADRR